MVPAARVRTGRRVVLAGGRRAGLSGGEVEKGRRGGARNSTAASRRDSGIGQKRRTWGPGLRGPAGNGTMRELELHFGGQGCRAWQRGT